VIRWGEFAEQAPEIAQPAEALLRAFTLAFVGTLRPDGAPRVHPMTVTIHDGGLYVFPVHTKPRAADFTRDARYALHSFPRFREGTLESYVDDEFTCSGRAVAIDDPALRAAVLAVHNDRVSDADRLLRLDLDRAHHKTRFDGVAHYIRWSLSGGVRHGS
jgi:hypothetical protein